MHAQLLLCSKQKTKFEVPLLHQFQRYYCGLAAKKPGHATLTMPLFRVICLTHAGTLYNLLVCKIWSL